MREPIMVCRACGTEASPTVVVGEIAIKTHAVQVHHASRRDADVFWHEVLTDWTARAHALAADVAAVESEALIVVGEPCSWCREPFTKPYFWPFCSIVCLHDARGWLG